MVDEARLGAHESLALGSTYQALELAETGLTEAADDLELLSAAARAAWLAGLLHDADDHADRWLRLARVAADVNEEAAALGLRLRVAYDLGDLDAMAAYADALVAVVDLVPADEERAAAMAAVAQSYMLRDQIEAAGDWADKALALADAHGFVEVRRAALVEKGSALMLHPERFREAGELLRVAAREAEDAGDHVVAARALNNLVWHARRWRDPRRGAAAHQPRARPGRGRGLRHAGHHRPDRADGPAGHDRGRPRQRDRLPRRGLAARRQPHTVDARPPVDGRVPGRAGARGG